MKNMENECFSSCFFMWNPLTWCKTTKSFKSLHLLWYNDRREYMRWMIAVTLPKTTACIRAVIKWNVESSNVAEGKKGEKVTSNQHHYNTKNFLCGRISGDISEPDTRERGEREIKSRDIRFSTCDITYGYL